MNIRLSDTERIVSNPCGGYDLQVADIDMATGLIRINPKSGSPRWKFKWFMPTLDKMLRMYIEECTPVAGETLEGIQLICQTIENEYTKLRKTLENINLR